MAAKLQTVSKQMAAAVATAAPHVVRVSARRRMSASGVALGGGLIATASHVVRNENNIVVATTTGESMPAQLLGRDNTTDLAILKVEETLAKFPIADDVGAVGSLVFALGAPWGDIEATLSVISAVRPNWRTPMGGLLEPYIRTDVTMYPGFSGGPLINAEGHMIGLNSSALARGESVTIPAATVARVANAIAEHGHVARAFLGVSTQMAKLPRAVREEIGRKAGLLVVGVEPDTPAESAGLVMGDTIVAIADHAVQTHDDLLAQLTSDRIGKETPITVLRGGTIQDVPVTLGTHA